jgi:hypothetical protein
MGDSIALRVQRLPPADQVTVLSRLAQSRAPSGRFAPSAVEGLYDDIGLPRPAKIANVLGRLEDKGYVARQRNARGSWRLTPAGRDRSLVLVSEMDLVTMSAEGAADMPPDFARTAHPTMPPWLAPPELLPVLREFLQGHPFDLNVFGMTRFPDEQDDSNPDPVASALEAARRACADHGLEFHLASDRKLVDDLWQNVDAHMWACRYGIGFFEDRRGRGVNYNLTIEVGGMMTTGRRLALLKDVSIDRMPTDLVGKIYNEVDLEDKAAVGNVVHSWLNNDLRLGPCDRCPGERP